MGMQLTELRCRRCSLRLEQHYCKCPFNIIAHTWCTCCYGLAVKDHFFGNEAATTEQRRYVVHGRWISHVGVLIMLFGFLLLALGLPITADQFLRLLEELQFTEETDIHQSSNLDMKVDVSV